MSEVLTLSHIVDSGAVGSLGLRDLRELHGLFQADLATRLGIQQAAVSKVERRQDLHLDTIATIVKKVAAALAVFYTQTQAEGTAVSFRKIESI
jgi:transcriptional regulator with XRE-family HTH domain